MCKLKDLTGQKFNKLLVIKRVENNKEGRAQWLCQCECGNKKIIIGKNLLNGRTKSCGCLIKEVLIQRNLSHNKTYTRLYRIYAHMKERCFNPKCKDYKNYGGRGITICQEWLENFDNFYNWAYLNGYNDNAAKFECTIDRINVNGSYSPENCRWVSQRIQNRNTRRNVLISYKNEKHCLIEWCEILNLNYKKTLQRISNLNWSIEKAFCTP